MNQFCSAGQVSHNSNPSSTFFSPPELMFLVISNNQLCSPVIGRAWWVLAAVEQYTLYQNSLYTAIGFAADQAKGK
jgi:hypothetical protein